MFASTQHRIHRPLAVLATVALLAAGAAPAQPVVTTLILRTGDPAPQLGSLPVFIESFVEPPSIRISEDGSETFIPIRVTVMGQNVVAENKHVIYRWSRQSGLQKIVRTGEVVAFPSTVRAIVAVESPIANAFGNVAFTAQTDRPARGLVVAEGPSLLGMVEVGDPVSIACESVSGAPCGPVTGAQLATMPTFADRKGAAFAEERFESVPGSFVERNVSLFRGTVQTTGFGVPDALWYITRNGAARSPLINLANSLLKADDIGGTTYYDDFTDVALCRTIFGDPVILSLATVSQGAAFAAYRFNVLGVGQLLLRHHAPDMVPRRDFRCGFARVGFAGGVTDAPFNGDTAARSTYTMTQDGADLRQLYLANMTPAPGFPGATLGPPLGQAVGGVGSREGSVFAANLVGSPLAGAATVWRASGPADLALVAHEQQTSPYGAAITAIWTVHVGEYGDVVMHVRLADQRQAVYAVDSNDNRIPMLVSEAPLPGDPTRTMVSFWTLGGTFGADPVVTGAALDGIQGAFTRRGEIPVVVYTRPAGQPAGSPATGAALVELTVPIPPLPPLFADGFESPPPPK